MGDPAHGAGCLLGTLLGDSVALPAEGLPARRTRRIWKGPLRHRFLLGRGMASDDAEHAFLTAQALLAAGDDPARFQRVLAARLRWWAAALPAGVGMATLRACARLWLGIPPARAGVASGGNGAAMRATPIGVRFADDAARRRAFTDASTAITHRHPHARAAARVVAEAAALAVRGADAATVLAAARACGEDDEWPRRIDAIAAALAAQEDADACAVRLGCAGAVTGWSYHSVPFALFLWLRHRDDARAIVTAAIAAGGDTDTVAAIAGGLAGAGGAVLPDDLLARVLDWPRTPWLYRVLGERLAGTGAQTPVRYAWPLVPLRNLLFLAVVIAHGFRRMLPPR